MSSFLARLTTALRRAAPVIAWRTTSDPPAVTAIDTGGTCKPRLMPQRAEFQPDCLTCRRHLEWVAGDRVIRPRVLLNTRDHFRCEDRKPVG